MLQYGIHSARALWKILELFSKLLNHVEVTRGVLWKKVFLEISQNPLENTCARVSFFHKVAGLRPATLFKKRLWHRCFPVNFVKFLRTPLDDCFFQLLSLNCCIKVWKRTEYFAVTTSLSFKKLKVLTILFLFPSSTVFTSTM